MSKETGGPAFPIDRQTAHGIAISLVGSNNEAAYIEAVNQLSQGLTIRDYFAAKALQSILAAVWADEIHPRFGKMPANELATEIYLMADSMLEARK